MEVDETKRSLPGERVSDDACILGSAYRPRNKQNFTVNKLCEHYEIINFTLMHKSLNDINHFRTFFNVLIGVMMSIYISSHMQQDTFWN